MLPPINHQGKPAWIKAVVAITHAPYLLKRARTKGTLPSNWLSRWCLHNRRWLKVVQRLFKLPCNSRRRAPLATRKWSSISIMTKYLRRVTWIKSRPKRLPHLSVRSSPQPITLAALAKSASRARSTHLERRRTPSLPKLKRSNRIGESSKVASYPRPIVRVWTAARC